MIRCNLKTVRNHVAKREEFRCNETLIGKKENDPGFGWAKKTMGGVSLANHLLDSRDNFVIYSYDTPIAVFNNKGWWKNPDKYSVTTSRHMGSLGI